MMEIKLKMVDNGIYEDENSNVFYPSKDNTYVSKNKRYENIGENDNIIVKEIPLEKRVEVLKEKAEKLGAKIAFCDNKAPFFDNEHLDCFWYGGYVGSILYKGYMIDIEVQGEMDFVVLDENDETILEYADKTNSAAYYENGVSLLIKNDEHLAELCDEGKLIYNLNNWVEMFLRDEDGEDTGLVFDVLDDNVLDAFDDVEEYIYIIEEYIKNEKSKH